MIVERLVMQCNRRERLSVEGRFFASSHGFLPDALFSSRSHVKLRRLQHKGPSRCWPSVSPCPHSATELPTNRQLHHRQGLSTHPLLEDFGDTLCNSKMASVPPNSPAVHPSTTTAPLIPDQTVPNVFISE